MPVCGDRRQLLTFEASRNHPLLPETSIEKTGDRRSRERPGDGLTRDERLRELYEAYAHRVLGYAARRTDRDTARDVVSQTFLVAWRRIDEVPADPLGWLLGVARNVLANEHRAASRRAALVERVGPVSLVGADPSDTVGDRLRALDALDRLGEWDREALMLMAWERLDYAGAAAVLGCSRSVFKIRLHRARRRLTDALATTDPVDVDRRLLASRPQEAE